MTLFRLLVTFFVPFPHEEYQNPCFPITFFGFRTKCCKAQYLQSSTSKTRLGCFQTINLYPKNKLLVYLQIDIKVRIKSSIKKSIWLNRLFLFFSISLFAVLKL